jgi:glycosyltransferase involved in cell wall biosynthesis
MPSPQEPAPPGTLPSPPPGPVALFFAAKGGGVQRGRVTIANALAARGIEVACVLPEAEGPFLERLAPAVTLVDLKTRRPLALVRRLARYLRERRPAAVIASQQHAIVAAVLARRLARSDTLLAAIQHNTLSELCRQSRRPSVRWLLPLAARALFRGADRVCAVSEGVARDLAAITGIPARDIRIVHNPTVTPEIAGQALLDSGHRWLDAKDRPVVVGAGNLIPLKDFATLIRAFARDPGRGRGTRKPRDARAGPWRRGRGRPARVPAQSLRVHDARRRLRPGIARRGHAEHDHRGVGMRLPGGRDRLPLGA